MWSRCALHRQWCRAAPSPTADPAIHPLEPFSLRSRRRVHGPRRRESGACAVGQFDAVNPAMTSPNVLAIVNGDTAAGFTDLIQVLTGNAYCESGKVIPMFREFSEGRIREEKLRVHLYLWFNDWKTGDAQKFFPEVDAVHHAALCRYFNVDSAAMMRSEERRG